MRAEFTPEEYALLRRITESTHRDHSKRVPLTKEEEKRIAEIYRRFDHLGCRHSDEAMLAVAISEWHD